ncbi:MAG: GIY-YIG nuclease family protein [Bacteroidetes bacterium]|nr:MAG: GIY-YIG nuclease family protein [Bacteroidota bacterium]
MHYLYILQSELDQSYYVGSTQGVEQRLASHNAGRGRYTRKKMPWKLVYTEVFETKSEALIREKAIKNMKSRVYIENLLLAK